MNRVPRTAFLNPLSASALTLISMGIATYLRASALYPLNSPVGQLSFYAPMMFLALSFILLVFTRRWVDAVSSVFFAGVILLFAPIVIRTTAEWHVVRATWHYASAPLPAGSGTIRVRVRSMYAQGWSPLPPGYDPVWQVAVSLPNGTHASVTVPGSQHHLDVLVSKPGSSKHQAIVLTSEYVDCLVMNLNTLATLPDRPRVPLIRQGTFEWSWPSVTYKPAQGGSSDPEPQ